MEQQIRGAEDMKAHILNVPDVTFTTPENAQGASTANGQAILVGIAEMEMETKDKD